MAITSAVGIRVIVSYRSRTVQQSLVAIRRWYRECYSGKSAVDLDIWSEPDLDKAIATYLDSIPNSILVVAGATVDEVDARLPDSLPSGSEPVIILREFRTTPLSATLLENPPFVISNDAVEAVRKASIRIQARWKYSVRMLQSKSHYEMALKLRYRVWSNEGHICPERNASRSKMEVDYADRSSTALGLFARNGRLAGFVRLVDPLGKRPGHQFAHLKSIVEGSGDPVLRKNFAPPNSIRQSFDILEEFNQFRTYYRKLVKQMRTVAEVSRVIVTKSHRGQGLAEILVDSAVSLAQDRQVNVLMLACRTELEPLYTRSGFSRVPGMVSDKFINIKAESIVMERALDGGSIS